MKLINIVGRCYMATRSRIFKKALLIGLFALYTSVGLAPVYADDIDIYTVAVASGNSGGSPTLTFVLDSSGSMGWRMRDSNNPSSIHEQRMFVLRDALHAQLTNIPKDYVVALMKFRNGRSGDLFEPGRAMNTEIVASTYVPPAVGNFSENKIINSGADDVEQIDGSSLFATGSNLDLAYGSYGSGGGAGGGAGAGGGLGTVDITSGSWVSIGSSVTGNWAPSVNGRNVSLTGGNPVFVYEHRSNNSSQTFLLDGDDTPSKSDPYLALIRSDGVTLGINDDRGNGGIVCPSGYTRTGSSCYRYCSSSDASNNNYGCSYWGQYVYTPPVSTGSRRDSTLTYNGLVNGQRYFLVASTYYSNQTDGFTLAVVEGGRGGFVNPSAGGGSNEQQRIGLKFRQVEVPSGAKITSAYLQFKTQAPSSDPVKVTVGTDRDLSPVDFGAADLFHRTIDWGSEVAMPVWSTPNEQGVAQRLDVTALLSDKITQDGWCERGDVAFVIKGNAADTFARHAYTFERDAASAARLVVNYEIASADDICTPVSRKISSSSEDSNENSSGVVSFVDSQVVVSANKTAGLRFTLMGLMPGAQSKKAILRLKASNTLGTPPKITIRAMSTGPFPKAIGPDGSDLSVRPTFTHVETWTPPQWQAGHTYSSPDISDLINKVLDNAWEYRGSIALTLSSDAFNELKFYSWDQYDGSGSRNEIVNYGQSAPELALEVQAGAISNAITHRDVLAAAVLNDNSVPALPASTFMPDGGTPIIGSYADASNYMLGVDEFSPGNTPGPAVLSGSQCSTDAIIVLSDGEETGDYSSSADANNVRNAPTLAGGASCGSGSYWSCATNTARALLAGATAHDGSVHKVKTYSILFGPGAGSAGSDLRALASAGGGIYYAAESSGRLSQVFKEILSGFALDGAAIAAPGVSVNALNRFESSDQLYYALFLPDVGVNWAGNLKRYAISNGNIEDQQGGAAVDSTTGYFSNDSHSWWSTVSDGAVVNAGGASGELGQPSTRQAYTYLGGVPTSPIAIKTGGGEIKLSNTALDAGVLGIDQVTGSETWSSSVISAKRTAAINMLTGGTDGLPSYRWGGVIHSTPSLVYYDKDTSGQPISTMFVSDNMGYLHAISAGESNGTSSVNAANTGGKELFAFMPAELLRNQLLLSENTNTMINDGMIYGLDASWSSWHNDTNKNRKVDGSDAVYIYGGMRRGGKNYYAFDVTTVRADQPSGINPKLQFVIEGGSSEFPNMGQTWSQPQDFTVRYNGVKRRVLMFGGGYDAAAHDGAAAYSSTTQKGSQVFMVDAVTGERLWWAAQSGSNTNMSNMKHSITAAVYPVDKSGDGVVDMFYAFDLGGQVLRFDIDPYNSGASDFVSASYTLAQLGAYVNGAASSDAADNRRFFDSASISLDRVGNRQDAMIAIGSGHRGSLHDVATQDRVFVIRDFDALGHGAPTSVLTMSDFDQIADSGDTQLQRDNNRDGIFYNLQKGGGEKVTGRPVITNHALLFTTYVNAPSSFCAPAIGKSRLYILNLYTGEGLVNVDNADVDPHNLNNDKFIDDAAPGLTSAPQMLLFSNDRGGAVVCVGTNCVGGESANGQSVLKGGGGGGDGCSAPLGARCQEPGELYGAGWFEETEQ